MFRIMMRSKIHRASVTEANLDYVGSLTIDQDLMHRADLIPGERVDVVDLTNGARLATYVIMGPANSGTIGINGAAAHHIHVGDTVIIIAYGILADEEAEKFRSTVVFVDERNQVVDVSDDPGIAPAGSGLLSGGLVESEHEPDS